MQATTLTADRFFLITYFFWMAAGCLLVFPVVLVIMSASNVIWPGGFSISVRLMEFAKQLGILIAAAGIVSPLFFAGLRNREVVLGANGVVMIRWGHRMPITLRRIAAAALQDFTVSKEARYALTPRATSTRYSLRQMPHRWRLTAIANGKKVNLGSYITEADARHAIVTIQTK